MFHPEILRSLLSVLAGIAGVTLLIFFVAFVVMFWQSHEDESL